MRCRSRCSQNRLVKNAALEAQKHDFRVNAASTRRLPQFQFDVLAGQLLHSFDFTFPAGAFGTYAGTGPIPSTEAKVRTPATFTTFLTGNIDLPLVHQYKIGLGIRATELGREIAREGVGQNGRRSPPMSVPPTSTLSRPRPPSTRRGTR